MEKCFLNEGKGAISNFVSFSGWGFSALGERVKVPVFVRKPFTTGRG
jgi:hypothetical protein